MPISVHGDDVYLTTTVTGPRGRSRQVRTRVNLSIDKEGIHSKMEFMGPLGRMWQGGTTISFQEIIEVLREKPGGLKSFLKLVPSDLVYVLKQIAEA